MESATGASTHLAKRTQGYSVTGLASTIQKAIQSQVNGQLIIQTREGTTWALNFRVGRLFWAGGGEQPFRRWRRLLKQFCKLAPEALQVREQDIPTLWEHWLLNILLKRQGITRQDAGRLVEHGIEEVLFDVLQASSSITTLTSVGDSAFSDEEPIAILSTADMLQRAQASLGQWFNLGLMAHYPNHAPSIPDPEALRQQLPPKLAQALISLATGRASLRELATITGQPLMTISGLMSQGIHKHLIELSPLADIAHPYSKQGANPGANPGARQASAAQRTPVAGGAESGRAEAGRGRGAASLRPQAQASLGQSGGGDRQPTILCVDDSAQVSYILEQILQPAGYRFIGVQDSVKALSAILKNKPDLIFLDLIMPLVYGNEICTQVRRAPSFRDLPIIMLSGNARMLDRLQARGAGATDFMSKPIEAGKVLALVRRYLQAAPLGPRPGDLQRLAAADGGDERTILQAGPGTQALTPLPDLKAHFPN
ncbi:MAG: response regulator [Synechococcales cyanobacterium RM1_1_8]|nr:response regulator [Synechococcales cyanobacterium RM1_1_8]